MRQIHEVLELRQEELAMALVDKASGAELQLRDTNAAASMSETPISLSRTCMKNTLKMIIQNTTKNNRIWSTDWDS